MLTSRTSLLRAEKLLYIRKEEQLIDEKARLRNSIENLKLRINE